MAGGAPAIVAGAGVHLTGTSVSAPSPTVVHLYSPITVGFLPPDVDTGHHHSTSGWLPTGDLAPISGALSS